MSSKYAYHIEHGYGYEDIWVIFDITDPVERETIKRMVLDGGSKRIFSKDKAISVRTLGRELRKFVVRPSVFPQ